MNRQPSTRRSLLRPLSTLFLIIAAVVGAAPATNAVPIQGTALTLLTTFKPHSGATEQTEVFAMLPSSALPIDSFQFELCISILGQRPGSMFSMGTHDTIRYNVIFNADNTATITLNSRVETESTLFGAIFVEGANGRGNLYAPIPATQVVGPSVIQAPFNGHSHHIGRISHIDIFCFANVPDAGPTVMLLGLALAGLALLRRLASRGTLAVVR